jgi:hypothetical protein
VVIFVETERGRRRGEEPYSRRATTPDGGIAKGSAKSTALRLRWVMAASVGVVVIIGRASPSRAQSPDDHAAAAALLQKLEVDTAHSPITASAVVHAKEALERATRLRSVRDEAHAKAADGLALEWAETGRDLARAADAEAQASDLRRNAVEAQARLERARALVEAWIARVGRLRSELEEASRAAPKDRTAIEVHDGDRTSGRKAEPAGQKEEKRPKDPARGETP